MKKIDAHQWVQSLANIGVIASIIFLSVQVGQNRRSLDEANKINAVTLSSNALEHVNNFLALIASDEQLAQIWVKGRAGEQLTPVETARFEAYCESRIWVQAWVFRQMPSFDRPESAAAVAAQFHTTLKQPGFKACWDETKQFMSDYGYGSFVRAVDAIEDTQALPLPAPVPPPSNATPIKADDEKQR
jgi:hypothetical protein